MPAKRGSLTRPIAERFWPKVEIGSPSDCWIWHGARLPRGYGRVATGRHCGTTYFSAYAHRVAWELANGPIPDGLFVCHRCDNPPCVNPAHLFLGSAQDNNRDKAAKGRYSRARRKLTLQQADELRGRYVRGVVTQTALAREYGISRRAVGFIIAGYGYHG